MIFVKIWRFTKKWWWTFVLGAITVLSFVGGILFFDARKKEEENRKIDDFHRKPTYKERAATQIERIQLEGEIERARIETRYEERKAEIDKIEEIGKDDPVEARRRLASWLNNNL